MKVRFPSSILLPLQTLSSLSVSVSLLALGLWCFFPRTVFEYLSEQYVKTNKNASKRTSQAPAKTNENKEANQKPDEAKSFQIQSPTKQRTGGKKKFCLI
jgi:hypothetical protein